MNDFGALVTELHDLQDGRCGVCGRQSNIVVDHDHLTGMVRGLLCQTCNLREGRHGDCATWNDCGICRWRRQPAVSVLGWTCHYVPSGIGVIGPRAVDPLLPGQRSINDRLVVWAPLCVAIDADAHRRDTPLPGFSGSTVGEIFGEVFASTKGDTTMTTPLIASGVSVAAPAPSGSLPAGPTP